VSLEIYLDNSATTRVHPRVAEVMMRCFTEQYGNPSSLHTMGAGAERSLEEAREVVARYLGVSPSEVYFTSGGTEGNNMVLRGGCAARRSWGRHLITTAVEHPSVLRTCQALEEEGWEVTYLPVDRQGRIDPEDLGRALREDTALVSVMMVNNEVGSLQPVEAIGEILKGRTGRRPLFHVDAVQAVGKLPLRPSDWGVDALTASGHKFHGPKGVGFLYLRQGVEVSPLMTGGEQERGLRPGTENVPGAVGLARALELSLEEFDARAVAALRDLLVSSVLEGAPDAVWNGYPEGAPHIANISFPGVSGEMMVHHLAEAGVYVSTGSACSSRKPTSHVLEAMGLEEELLQGALRFSLSAETTEADVRRAAAVVVEVYRELKELFGRG